MKCYTTTIKNKEVLYVFKGADLQDRLLGEKSKTQISVSCMLQFVQKEGTAGEKKKYLLYMFRISLKGEPIN